MDNTPYEQVPLEAPIEPEILGVTPEKKKMKKSTLIIIIVAAVLVLCCCIAIIVTLIVGIPAGLFESYGYSWVPLLRVI